LAPARDVLCAGAMGYPLRWNRTDLVYEVTIETIQGRYLLRPTREVRDLVNGVLARAQARYRGVSVFAFVFTRDRAMLLLSSSVEDQLPRFMAYLKGGISRKLGRLLDWSGTMWAGRYRSTPILDEDAIVERLRHVLSLGVDEGLVLSPRDWPGATCVPALLGSMKLEGTWIDRDHEASLRALGLEPPAAAYMHGYRVELTPIPGWEALPPAELAARYRAIIESIELEYLVVTGGEVVGPVELQLEDPFSRRRSAWRRLRALCHATCDAVKDAFRSGYRAFCSAFRSAAAALRGRHDAARELTAGFPAGSYPRPDLRVPLSTRSAAATTASPNAAAADDPLDQTLRDESAEPAFELATTRWSRDDDAGAVPVPMAGPRRPPDRTRRAPPRRDPEAPRERATDGAGAPRRDASASARELQTRRIVGIRSPAG
jgi:hypothetical protein